MTMARMETLPAMLLAGIRQHHALDAAPREIPQQWAAFNALPLRAAATVAYGVTCQFDGAAQQMEYLCAVAVPSFEGLPEGTGRMRIPAAQYAVFDVADPGTGADTTGIPAGWGRAMHWEATNGAWRDAQTPSFERYEGGRCTIWLPVVRREAGA